MIRVNIGLGRGAALDVDNCPRIRRHCQPASMKLLSQKFCYITSDEPAIIIRKLRRQKSFVNDNLAHRSQSEICKRFSSWIIVNTLIGAECEKIKLNASMLVYKCRLKCIELTPEYYYFNSVVTYNTLLGRRWNIFIKLLRCFCEGPHHVIFSHVEQTNQQTIKRGQSRFNCVMDFAVNCMPVPGKINSDPKSAPNPLERWPIGQAPAPGPCPGDAAKIVPSRAKPD
jgi:hypothetical protein